MLSKWKMCVCYITCKPGPAHHIAMLQSDKHFDETLDNDLLSWLLLLLLFQVSHLAADFSVSFSSIVCAAVFARVLQWHANCLNEQKKWLLFPFYWFSLTTSWPNHRQNAILTAMLWDINSRSRVNWRCASKQIQHRGGERNGRSMCIIESFQLCDSLFLGKHVHHPEHMNSAKLARILPQFIGPSIGCTTSISSSSHAK